MFTHLFRFVMLILFLLTAACADEGENIPDTDGDADIDNQGSEQENESCSECDMDLNPEADFEIESAEVTENIETDVDGDAIFHANPYTDCGDYLEYDAPYSVLSNINPFPCNGYMNLPSTVVDGQPWFVSYIPVLWPAMIQPVDIGAYYMLLGYHHSALKVWNQVWWGNNHGGIWSSNTGENQWETLTEMQGSAARSLAYDPAGNKIIGAELCDVLMRYSDGRSRIRHYDADMPFNDTSYYQACQIDGYYTERNVFMAEYFNEVYMYRKLIIASSEDKANDTYMGGLFRMEDEDFKLVCAFELPETSEDTGSTSEWLGKPLQYKDLLILPGVPGRLMAWDGQECLNWYESPELGFSENLPKELATDGVSLFVATAYNIYRKTEDSFDMIFETQESGVQRDLLYSLIYDAENNRLFAGGISYGEPMLVYSEDTGDTWKYLGKDLYSSITDLVSRPTLASAAFAPSGKGFVSASNKLLYNGDLDLASEILRFDGHDWYKWTKEKFDVRDLYTPDGETLWALGENNIWRMNENEGIKNYTYESVADLHFNTLVPYNENSFYILADNGIWLDFHDEQLETHQLNSDINLRKGVLYKGELYVTDGPKLYRMNAEEVEEIEIPEYPPDYQSGDYTYSPPTSIGGNQHYFWDFCDIHLVSDEKGHLWLGRNDGIWLWQEDNSWEKLAGSTAMIGRYDLQVGSLVSCGSGVCRVAISPMVDNDITNYFSWLDVVRKNADDEWELFSRNFDYDSYSGYVPLGAARVNENSTVFVGTQGFIAEYGNRVRIPCIHGQRPDLPVNFITENTFDEDEFYGSCQSSNAAETVNCTEGMCAVPGGDFCIGGTRTPGWTKQPSYAGMLPTRQTTLDQFRIDQQAVTRQQYADFISSLPEGEKDKCLPFNTEVVPIFNQYGIGFDDEGTLKVEYPDSPLDFGTQVCAEDYCELQGKRLCSAAEWEAACRGFDDEPFAGGQEFAPAVEGEEDPIPYPSDFGVEGIGNRMELVSDHYSHDALRFPDEPPPDYAGATIMGGWNRPCWWRNEEHYRLHPVYIGFRCCMDGE